MSGLPARGFTFWPVGTGDSTTITVAEETVIQVDLHQRSDSEDPDSPYASVIAELKEALPQKDGTPYLSVFGLTHPDQDHCKGFERLLDEVKIGELWATPQIFREYHKDLCDDASAFKKEMERRVDATIGAGGDPGAGDRVRLFGWDELLNQDDYSGFPDDWLTIPGNSLTRIDGADYGQVFRAFVHAPFKDGSAGERNDTSLALQVALSDGGAEGRALLLGDLCYPTVRRIFDISEHDDLRWDVLLAPHHCSKSVMYWRGPDDDEEVRKQDILDDLEEAAEGTGWVVASSEPIKGPDEEGQNPPHAVARARYEEIAPDGFLCTQEEPDEESPQPLKFTVSEEGITRQAAGETLERAGSGWSAAVAAARGTDRPPSEQVGFGRG